MVTDSLYLDCNGGHTNLRKVSNAIACMYSKMAQRVKTFAAKLENLNSIPWTYMVEGENQFP